MTDTIDIIENKGGGDAGGAAQILQPELPAQGAPLSGPLRPALAIDPGSTALENEHHELFCQHVTGYGGSGDPVAGYQAYIEAYGVTNPATARVNASRLAARTEVKERCAWMRGQLAASVLLDKAAVRAMLYKKRMAIVEKTEGSKNKEVALSAMRDIEKSMGLDAADVSRSTVTEESTEQRALAVSQIGEHVEAVAAQIAAQRVTVKTIINE